MRIALLGVVAWIGCGDDRSVTEVDARVPIDAPTVDAIDAQTMYCEPGTGTATVTASTGGASTTYTQLHAGGIWFLGPAAAAAAPDHGVDMSAFLMFMNVTEQLPQQTGWCCSATDTTCCTHDGIVVETDGLGVGAEVGNHVVRIRSFQDPAYRFTGTLTITEFAQPFEEPPGRIAGSVTATDGNRSVSGTFDNTFCAALLTATI